MIENLIHPDIRIDTVNGKDQFKIYTLILIFIIDKYIYIFMYICL